MKLLWFVSSLEQKGGGERFVLEGAKAIREDGHEIKIVCDRLNNTASFDGQYDLSDIVCNTQGYDLSLGYIASVLLKSKGLISLYRVIKKESPDLVICQSEFDAIKLYIISKFINFNYRVFVFGQMFQFKHDISKYSSVFRKHLLTIRDSRPGYKSTVITPPPKTALPAIIVNEIISRLKLRALQNAERIFTLSEQVKWEVELLYKRNAQVCRAAFNENFIDIKRLKHPKKLNKPVRFLSVSRLADKKRIDLIIKAFSNISNSAELIIIGTGPEEKKLKKLASSNSNKNSTQFLGSVTEKQLEEAMNHADCFVSMDIGDFDISVIEAMGKGLRVLVPTDFDLSGFNNEFTGVESIEPNETALTLAMGSVNNISPPTLNNLPLLKQMTWQYLAKKCIAS